MRHADARTENEVSLPLGTWHGSAPAEDFRAEGLLVSESPAVYRPRHPERTAFYRLLDQHFERYACVHEERYEQRHGPLRPVVPETVNAYLDCGRLQNGFARIRCPSCKGEHLLAFSCQTRNFCPSCQAKRAALFAERLEQEIVAKVPHRHVVFTIPKVLRGLMQRERRLLSLLPRCAFEAMRTVHSQIAGKIARGDPGRCGMVASIQTFGAFANWNPHVHAIVSDGLLLLGGGFIKLPRPDPGLLEEVFRRLVLSGLNRLHRLSDAFMASLLCWRHSGFSVYLDQVLPPDAPERTAHVARYLVRPPVPKDGVSLEKTGRAVLDTPTSPRSKDNAITFDPLDWVHAICTQIPDKGQHLVRYLGAYANRVRARYRHHDDGPQPASDPDAEAAVTRIPEQAHSPFLIQRRRAWARLLRKILEVDPLLCPKCGIQMKIISVIQDPRVVDRILKHLKSGQGHDPFEPRAPPAA